MTGVPKALSVTYAIELSKLFSEKQFFFLFHFFSHLSRNFDTREF
jgi:hypothetical protein